jgi:hypothetical protein
MRIASEWNGSESCTILFSNNRFWDFILVVLVRVVTWISELQSVVIPEGTRAGHIIVAGQFSISQPVGIVS